MRDILKLCGRREWVSIKNTSEELWGKKYPLLTGDMAHVGVTETWDLQKKGNKYFLWQRQKLHTWFNKRKI